MASAEDFERIARALPGTVEAPHFDRTAFKVARTYATLAPDRLSANLKFDRDQQALKCTVAADAFAPVPGGWGRMGYTTVRFAAVTEAELHAAVEMAWANAQPKKRAPRRR